MLIEIRGAHTMSFSFLFFQFSIFRWAEHRNKDKRDLIVYLEYLSWRSLLTVPQPNLLDKWTQSADTVILHAFPCSSPLTCVVAVIHTVWSFCCFMYIYSADSSLTHCWWKIRFDIRHPGLITHYVSAG